MRATLILVLSLSSGSAFAARWSVGTALEARAQREINSDYTQLRNSGQLFAQARFLPWVAHVELGREDQRTRAGAVGVDSRSLSLAGWGRFEFENERRWKPFLGSGIGAYFDQVSTRFGAEKDIRQGRRLFAGIAVGLTAIYWENLLVELEGRTALVEDREEPNFSALVRLGVQI